MAADRGGQQTPCPATYRVRARRKRHAPDGQLGRSKRLGRSDKPLKALQCKGARSIRRAYNGGTPRDPEEGAQGRSAEGASKGSRQRRAPKVPEGAQDRSPGKRTPIRWRPVHNDRTDLPKDRPRSQPGSDPRRTRDLATSDRRYTCRVCSKRAGIACPKRTRGRRPGAQGRPVQSRETLNRTNPGRGGDAAAARDTAERSPPVR